MKPCQLALGERVTLVSKPKKKYYWIIQYFCGSRVLKLLNCAYFKSPYIYKAANDVLKSEEPFKLDKLSERYPYLPHSFNHSSFTFLIVLHFFNNLIFWQTFIYNSKLRPAIIGIQECVIYLPHPLTTIHTIPLPKKPPLFYHFMSTHDFETNPAGVFIKNNATPLIIHPNVPSPISSSYFIRSPKEVQLFRDSMSLKWIDKV